MRLIVVLSSLFYLGTCLAVERIISTAPAITEIVSSLGSEGQLVGISNYCRYPKSIGSISKIGTALDLEFEKVIRLKPDLLIMSKSSELLMKKKVGKLKLNSIWIKTENLEDIYKSILHVGIYISKKQKSINLVKSIKNELSSYALEKPKKALLVVGTSLSSNRIKSAFVAGGRENFYNDLLKELNIINPATRDKAYYKLDFEDLLKIDADKVFLIYPSTAKVAETLLAVKAWNLIPNFKNKIISIVGDFATTPGPRINLLGKKISEEFNVKD